MTERLLKTKTYIPSPRLNVVPRPHLVERLDSGFGEGKKLILVSAPAGFGKTTLVSDWIAQTGRPVAWLSLDEDDNDMSRFLALLVTTCKTLQPDLSETTLTLARSNPQPRTVLTELINELDVIASPFALVLDDYHVIHAEPIHAALNYLVDHLPSMMRVIVTTRGDPPFPLARWRARDQLTEIRADDLRFSQEEMVLFFKAAARIELSVQDIATLERRTEGWAAGLQLAALALQARLASQAPPSTHARPDIHEFLASFGGSHQYVIDYLVEEVYNCQPENVQSFLLQTCIFARLCGPLCDAITGQTDGQETLEMLERANLFIVPLDAERRWYRYHPLFAEVLSSLQPEIGPERTKRLHLRASEWYEQNGFMNEAIQHALAGRDFASAARQIERVAEDLLWNQGEFYTLSRWLGSLPEEVLRSRPRLCLSLAWVSLWSNRLEVVEPLLFAAEGNLAQNQRERTAFLGESAAIQAELARVQAKLSLALAKAQDARQLLAEIPDEARQRGVILGILGGVYRANGNAEEAYRTYAEAVRLMEAGGQIVPVLIASGYQIQLLMIQGQLRRAADLYQNTRKWAIERRAGSLPPFGVIQIAMGQVLREQNELDAAEGLLREGIGLCLQWDGMADDAFDGLLSLARVLQARGATSQADEAMQQADQLAHKYSVPDSEAQIGVWQARLSVMRGDVKAAAYWMHERGLNAQGALSYPREAGNLMLARWLLTQNHVDQAAPLLARLLENSRAGARLGRTIEILALQALALHRAGDLEQALDTLAQVFALAEPEGYVRTFVDEGPGMEKLLRLAVARGVSGDYAAALLRAFDPPSPPRAQDLPGVQPLVEPLTARELEVLRLLSAGLTNREIADEFFVTLGTVKSHVNRIYRKLEAPNRVRAISRARELNLLE